MTRDEFDLREAAAFVITPGGMANRPTLMGWTDGPASSLPLEVRRDIASGVRMAATAKGVQAELDTGARSGIRPSGSGPGWRC
ncbi:hypothetical protein M6G65_33200 (plasmid) [Methylobacterium tardum]|uniref:hypothetical protein n=1 Tax=Methylobacterium tardum TaxID=374432 RepID=UPI0020212D11|nr:hypothetical protein [Methylobacterium tardum]URD40307.1 hypothetical protein M6G65_33200 [Methylobacterium tardum]